MSEIKYAYQMDQQGHYVGMSPRQPSPLEPGVHLIPAGCVLVAPPDHNHETHHAKWDGKAWALIEKPKKEEHKPADPAPLQESQEESNAEVPVEKAKKKAKQ